MFCIKLEKLKNILETKIFILFFFDYEIINQERIFILYKNIINNCCCCFFLLKIFIIHFKNNTNIKD